jgi:hypothetical protein
LGERAHPAGAALRTPEQIRAAVDEMDNHHEAGIKQFLANASKPITQGKGNQRSRTGSRFSTA